MREQTSQSVYVFGILYVTVFGRDENVSSTGVTWSVSDLHKSLNLDMVCP